MSQYTDYNYGVSPMLTGHSLQLDQRLDRSSVRNSLIPTSRFTSTPNLPITATFASIPSVPSHIAELEHDPHSFGSATTLAVLEGKRHGAKDSFSIAGSSIYSTTHDFKPQNYVLSPNRNLTKLAIKRGIRANWTPFIPHILSICITVSVSQLGFRNVFWMDLLPSEIKIAPGLTQTGVLKILQFAAKFHELTILASISTIVLHIFQISLTGPDGIPLGLMANAFELGSGSFLRQNSFWKSITSSNDSSGKRFRFTHLWALLFSAAVLVLISGPASAIAIIPSLEFFDLQKPFDQNVRPMYIFNQSIELWPTQLTTESLNCTDAAVQDSCPTVGFQEIYDWRGGLMSSTSKQAEEILIYDDSSNTRRTLTVKICNSTFHGRASGIGINAFLHRALTSYWTYAQRNLQGKSLSPTAQPQINVANNLYAPHVEVICNFFPSSNTSVTFPNTTITVPNFAYNLARPSTGSNFTFLEVSGQGPPFLGAILTMTNTTTSTESTENIACSVYTSWIPISISYEPTISNSISYKIRTSLQNTCLETPTSPSKDFREEIDITMSPGYLAALNQKMAIGDSDNPALSTVLGNVLLAGNNKTAQKDSNEEEEKARNTRNTNRFAALLAGIITNTLSLHASTSLPILLLPNRTSSGELQGRFLSPPSSPIINNNQETLGSIQDLPLNTTDFNATKEWVRLKPQYRRYGYGWRFGTSRFGICILLVHAFVALVHVLVLGGLLMAGKGVVRGWESIPDLVALGVGRRSDGDMSAAVREKGMWRNTNAVKDCDDGGGLEVVVGVREAEEGRVVGRGREVLIY